MQHEPHPRNSPTAEPAAQYLRMSKDEQDYSIFNQEEAISAYAVAHNFAIVRTYSDDGRSGLLFDSRPGLRRLISDVQSGQANFSAVLVYDVSRWGRFQDVDEGAYYEQLCKKAGVRVVFCVGEFKNDGSLASIIMKSLDRAEAANYSARLSIRVFAGHCNLSRRGYWQGGPAGYGLRRVLIDAGGSIRTILGAGERKFIQSDRVVLRPGPADEVALVQRIFRSFAFDGKNEITIANELNREGRVNEQGRPWNRCTITNILKNEKYVGHNVYGRTSTKLKSNCVKKPPEMWVRSNNAFEAVVDPKLFSAAQQKINEITNRKSNQRMLDNLRTLLAAKGRLTSKIINDAEFVPSTGAYHDRFGSLLKAYELIGYKPPNLITRNEAWQEGRNRRRRVLSNIFADFRRLGLTVRFDWNRRAYIVDNKVTLAAYMLKYRTDRGATRWTLRQCRTTSTALVVGIRMDTTNENVYDYLLLHTAGLAEKLRKSDVNVEQLCSTKFQTVDDLAMALKDAALAI